MINVNLNEKANLIHEAMLKHVEKFGKKEFDSMIEIASESFAPMLNMDPEVFKKNARIFGSNEFQVVESVYKGLLLEKAMKILEAA